MAQAFSLGRLRLLPLVLLVPVALAACGGGGKTYTAEIGAAGGSLVGPGGATVTVPADALTTTVTFEIRSAPSARRPTGTASVAAAIRLDPEGQTFLKPLDVTIPISPSALPSGMTVDDVVVIRAPHGSTAYVPLPSRRVGNAVVCQTEHFSDFIAVVFPAGTPFGQCGDAMCLGAETCDSCPYDCGLCGGGGGTDGGADSGPVDSGTDAGPVNRFVDNADGSATDTVTTLQWETAPVTSLTMQAAATSTCTALTIGGHSDWRLPTVQETISLVDYTRFSPAFDSSVFPAVPTFFWTTTTYAGGGGAAWVMTSGASLTQYVTTFAGAAPWCVRGADVRPGPVMVDNGDMTVTDTSTGLMYAKAVSTSIPYATAQSTCASLSLGAAGAWRVPTLLEMFRTARFDLMPALDIAVFNSNGSINYWTSTPSASAPATDVWYWEQGSGSASVAARSGSMPVRCVR